ncbi:NAD(P)-dependent oxidoreductase, partial [Candidatus Micrarchaeota archaeon]|nr:NAD(P)-dependent oxidoreductase [Candidatus Micrarchaeota archaeon]
MRILVTGGTGAIGRELCTRLAKKHQVASFSNTPNPELEKAGIKQIPGDVTNSQDCLKILAFKPDVIYHLAAELNELSPNLWKVNVEGTRNVLAAARKAGVKRFLHISTASVLGSARGKPLIEEDPYQPRTAYERSKAAGEKLVIESSLPYTILRPSLLITPNVYWRQIFEAARKHYPVIGKGDNNWHCVYLDDVLDALLLALKPAAENKVYNIAGPDAKTYYQTYQLICKVLGIEMTHKHVPKWLVNAACLVHETKCRLTGKKPNVTLMRTSVLRLTENRLISIEKAKRELGYKPKVTTEEAIRKT